MEKLKSRKFWMAVAAFLGSIGMSIAGLVTSEKWIVVVGTVCAMLSAAIYAAIEAYCDCNAGDDEYVKMNKDNAYLAKIKSTYSDGSTVTSEFKELTTK